MGNSLRARRGGGTKGIDPQLVARALCQLGHVRRLDRLGLRCPLDANVHSGG